MIYKKARHKTHAPGGFFRFENDSKDAIQGFGEGDYIQLKDEFGTTWRGSAQRQDDNTIVYHFRDDKGRHITGVSDSNGVVLRDGKGNTWRGFVD